MIRFEQISTGGNPLVCAAAIAAINITFRERLWEVATSKGDYLIPRLESLAIKYPQIFRKITGKGLLIGMHFQTPEIGYQIASGLFKRGVLIAGTLISAQTVRIEPPLIISIDEIDHLLNRLEATLVDVSKVL